ncbi:MAG: hypothetical protein QXM75_02565 [Candidatus Diapherotrites archaeon]
MGKKNGTFAGKKRKIFGLVQNVKIKGKKKTVETLALLDTGASRSSIDLRIAAKAGLGPIVGVIRIKSKTDPKGYVRRPIVEGFLEMCGKRKKILFTLADRQGMKLPVLVGRDFIDKDFVIEIEKSPEEKESEDGAKSRDK